MLVARSLRAHVWLLTLVYLVICCSVNEAVLNTPANPLLVVNQRLQLVMAERRKQRSAGQQKGQQESRVVSAAKAGTAGSLQQQQQQQPVLRLQGAGLVTVPAVTGLSAR
jgi:hypothetical protein